jgi:hypothetical protein
MPGLRGQLLLKGGDVHVSYAGLRKAIDGDDLQYRDRSDSMRRGSLQV